MNSRKLPLNDAVQTGLIVNFLVGKDIFLKKSLHIAKSRTDRGANGSDNLIRYLFTVAK